MCTSCQWTTSGQGVFTVRNMDWPGPIPTALWVFPAGRKQVSVSADDPNPMTWTSKYGSVATEIFELGTGDGLNEKGLKVGMLYLSTSDYGARDPKRPGMSVSVWVQYYLDNFATVAEAVADVAEHPYQVVTLEVQGRPGVVHLHLTDPSGDAAVIEVVDGKPNVYHGPQCEILTNNPGFPAQMENLKNYEGFGGTKPLPGTTAPEDRFVRAHYYRNALPKAEDHAQALSFLTSVGVNVAQPYGTPTKERPMVSPTVWRTMADQTKLIYYYESTQHLYRVWFDLANLDFSVGAPEKTLPLAEMAGRIGEQSASLVTAPPYDFALL